MKPLLASLLLLGAAYSLNAPALAGPGHDHGDTKPAASGLATPRFSAQSDVFDAVGILGKDELVVLIDRAATNEPVLNATVELESGSIKAVGKFDATLGEYHFDGKPFQQTAVYPITLTIKAGKDADLLSAELDVHGVEAVTTPSSAIPHTFREHPVWVGVAALGIVGLAVGGGLLLRNKSVSTRRDRSAA